MKKFFYITAAGFLISLFLVFAAAYLNMHHGSPGSADTVNVPDWAKGIHTFFGPPLLALIIQGWCLKITIRTYKTTLKDNSKRGFVFLIWGVFFSIFLLLSFFSAFITIASGFV